MMSTVLDKFNVVVVVLFYRELRARRRVLTSSLNLHFLHKEALWKTQQENSISPTAMMTRSETVSHAQYSSVETMSHTCHFPFVVI